jgi:hypothetical protein
MLCLRVNRINCDLPHRDTGSRRRHRNGLKADHLAQHTAGRVGGCHQDSTEAKPLGDDGLQASKEGVR